MFNKDILNNAINHSYNNLYFAIKKSALDEVYTAVDSLQDNMIGAGHTDHDIFKAIFKLLDEKIQKQNP